MLPTPVLTTLAVTRLEIGHSLGLDRAIPIGAAVLTARLKGASVRFTIVSHTLQPSDAADNLLLWLDQHLTSPDATICGYRLTEAAGLLSRLPGADWSPALRAVVGCGAQPVVDLTGRSDDGPLTFGQACRLSRILCAPADPDERFAAWCRSDTARIDHHAQVDVIAAFRLVLRRIAALDPIERKISDAMSAHFTTWLCASPNAVARAHVGDLETPAS